MFALVLEWVLILSLFMVIAEGNVVRDQSDYRLGKEKVTQLHFFFHQSATGKNQTSVSIGMPSSNFPYFGRFVVVDDVMTVAVDRASEVIGNVQGFYALTDRSKISLVMAVDFEFTSGKYKGSSFSVMSRNPDMDPSREVAVVGGRGQFRLARGFAILTTRYNSDVYAIVEYNVTLLHY